jgi:predicted TIM-barrel fold metal-dependent hydrolase
MSEHRVDAPLCLPPRPLARLPLSKLPAGACDCHFHVFPAGAALAGRRSYTPRDTPLEDWLVLADALGIARGVLVQPSVYGFDNAVGLAVLTALPDRLRGVAVIAPESPSPDLERMHTLGVRGVRVNLLDKAGVGLGAAPALARLVRPFGWHVQFQVGPGQIAAVAAIVAREPMTAVIDHLALLAPGDSASAPGLAVLQRMLDGGSTYLKVSAPYRLAPPRRHPGVEALVRSLAISHPERLLWGSDWPHPGLDADMPDDADLVDAILAWLPDDVRRAVFVENPRALYWSQ